MSVPIISVVIPVFNQVAYVRAAVLSVLGQTVDKTAFEVIVVDDASTDESMETINDLPVRIFRLANNVGVAAPTNVGIRAARGAYLTFLDADDLMVEEALRWRLAWIKENPDQPIVAGRPAGIIDGEGRDRPEYQHVLHPKYSAPSELTLEYFKNGGAYPVPQWLYLYRREVFEKIGYLDESLTFSHDLEFLFRALKFYVVPVVFKPLVLRRLHADNTSLSQDRESGEHQLSAETIAVCKCIFAKYGIVPTQWNLWERGYVEE
jgi:glycosyltransferase involved in cell wall biosynthesis